MKKILIIITLLTSIIISGCKSYQINQIDFGEINMSLKTSKTYNKKELNKEKYESLLAYEEKNQENEENKFINSMIITYNEKVDVNIKDFANKNIANLKSSIGSIEIKGTKTMGFDCVGDKIIGIIKDFEITEKNNTSFYSQFFFIKNKKGYIISFNSDDENDNEEFKSSLKSLNCKK